MVDLTEFYEQDSEQRDQFLKAEDVEKSPSKIATVIYGGDKESNRFGRYAWILVEIDKQQKKLKLNKTLRANLKPWGTDTDQWIGKQISLGIAKTDTGQPYVIGAPAYKRVVEGLKK